MIAMGITIIIFIVIIYLFIDEIIHPDRYEEKPVTYYTKDKDGKLVVRNKKNGNDKKEDPKG